MIAEDVKLSGVEGFRDLDRMIGRAPGVVYYWLRAAFEGFELDHRRTMLRQSPYRLGRKATARNPRPIQIPRVGEAGPSFDLESGIRWLVLPSDKRKPRATPADLDDIRFEIETRNDLLGDLELGSQTIRPKKGKLLAVPIRAPKAKGRGKMSPAEFSAKYPNRQLVARKSFRSGALFLFERIRRRSGTRKRLARTKTGKVRSSQRKTLRDVLIPRWILLPSIRLRGRLGFYRSWDQLAPKRAQRLAFIADRIPRDIARGIR